MNMIGHHNKHVQFKMTEMIRDSMPTFPNHHPKLIQPHFSVNNIAEQEITLMRTNGDEIRPGGTIIETA